MYDVHIRYNLGGELGDGIEVFNNALFDNRIVCIVGTVIAQRAARSIFRLKKGWDVYPRNMVQRLEERFPVFSIPG